MSRVSKDELLKFLEVFDLELKRKITIVAVGGTAMTLLGIKESTKDIDFNIPSESDYDEFIQIENKIKPNIKIDCYSQNMIFSEALPRDYLKIAIKYKSKFDKIELYILNPIDIVCSKISRLDESDIEDIKECIKDFKFTKTQIKKRALKYSRAGSDDIFNQNLKYILQNFF